MDSLEKITDQGILLLLVLLLLFLPAASGAVGVRPGAILGLAALVLLLLFFVPRIAGPRGRFPSLRPQLWMLVAMVGVVGVAAFQLVPLPWGWIRSLRPAQGELLEALGAGGKATPLSLHPFHTSLGLCNVVAASTAFLLGAFWVRRLAQVNLILLSYVTVASVVALFGILQVLSGDDLPLYQFLSHPSQGRARGPFVGPNHFAGYLEMAIPVAIGYLLVPGNLLPSWRRKSSPGGRVRSRGGRIALVLVAVALLSAGVLRSLSRMGLLSLTAGLVLLVFALRGGGRRVFIGVGLALVVAIGMILLVGPDPALSRLWLLGESGGPLQRLVAWKMTAGVVGDFPVLGTGLRTFQDVSPIYQPGNVPGWYGESHNDYLNLVSDLGVVGAIFVALGGFFWWRRIREGWKAVSDEHRPLLAGCLAALFILLLHETVDFNLQIPANSFHFALIAGLAISIPRLSGPVPGSRGPAIGSRGVRRVVLALLGVCLALPAWGLCRMLGAEILSGGGGEEDLLRAMATNPLRHDFPHRRGRLLEADGRTEEALQAFLQATEANPLSGRSHYKAGVQEERLGRRDAARVRFERALRVAPNNPDLLYRVAGYRLDWWIQETGGEEDEAGLLEILRGFRRAGLLKGEFCGKGLATIGKVLDEARLLRLGRPETAEGHRALGKWMEKKGRWEVAAEEFERWVALVSEGQRPRAFLDLGEARARKGDLEGAREAFLDGSRSTSKRQEYLGQVFERFRKVGTAESGIPLWRRIAREDTALREEMQLFEARTLHLVGRPDKARPILLALKGGLLGAEASFHLFILEHAAGALVASEIHIREAIEARPREAAYRHHLARVLERQGKIDEALEEATVAVRLQPEEARYQRALERLLEGLTEGE